MKNEFPLDYEQFLAFTDYFGSQESLLIGKVMQTIESINLPAKQEEAFKKCVKDHVYRAYSETFRWVSTWVPRDELLAHSNGFGLERGPDGTKDMIIRSQPLSSNQLPEVY